MLFNSWQFLLFFPIVTFLYFLFPHKYRWILLLIASCFFYMCFIPIYILILFFTIIIDYVAGIWIQNSIGIKRKQMLMLSIFANVGVLFFFKYYNFFTENINELLFFLHIPKFELPFLDIILPIGLSFHTFQAMSYTIEVYKGNQQAEKHFGIYALYVMFYPQLVAGPIERPQNLLHQFKEPHIFSSNNLIIGLRLMLWGFFKKLVIADRLAIYSSTVFENPGNYHYLNLIIAVLFFSIQIYCDFSGYSDIAIGAAKTMGFELMINFNRPYFAKNIQEFWKRWHISLSTWFKDYLYISLGGNREGIKRTYFNLAIIFIVSGFWHGANWTYIIWGALHACYMIIYLIQKTKSHSKIKNIFGWFFTMFLVVIAWIFFRAKNVNDAFLIIKNIFSLKRDVPFNSILIDKTGAYFGKSTLLFALINIIILFIIEYLYTPLFEKLNNRTIKDILFFILIFLLIIFFGVFYNNSFIYFQF